MRGSNNACHYTYVHGVHKGVNPRHRTHFRGATTGVHLQFALITQAIHGWSDALPMHFFVEGVLHNSENKDISRGETCGEYVVFTMNQRSDKLISHSNPMWLLRS